MGNASAKDVHAAIDAGDVDKLEKILEAKPELIDALNSEGETPIFRACSNGNIDVVELLIDFEADITITCNTCMNMSCLHIAATDIYPEIVKILLENGADPNAKTTDGATPLHCAFQYCSFDIARLLILAGTDPFAVTTDGLMAFDVPPIESDDVTPFTPSKIEALKKLIPNCDKLIKSNIAVNNSKILIKNNDDKDLDIEEMRIFFKESGLGNSEAKLCSIEAVNRGAKTPKKLAILIKKNQFSLQDLMDKAGSQVGLEDFVIDDLDFELVSIALTNISNLLYPPFTEKNFEPPVTIETTNVVL